MMEYFLIGVTLYFLCGLSFFLFIKSKVTRCNIFLFIISLFFWSYIVMSLLVEYIQNPKEFQKRR
jgi:hypothetical protein